MRTEDSLEDVTFSQLLVAELPFMLNLPAGTYPVALGTGEMILELLQERCAVHAGARSYLLVPVADLRPEHRGSAVALRTLVQYRQSRTLSEAEVLRATDEEVIQELASQQLDLGRELEGSDLLNAARSELASLDETSRNQLVAKVSRKYTARRIFGFGAHGSFVDAINMLVRRYMVEFDDPFAEEIVLHHLAATWTRGVMQILQCDDELVDSTHFAGKIPPIVRRQWLIHPSDRVDRFRSALAGSALVDPVALLAVRAGAFLERGANRSAVIEASAALETAVARRIKVGLVRGGMGEEEAAARLRQTQRFSDRCKSLFAEATGASLAQVDPSLWERVVSHRDNYRHKVTHDDSEPSADGARQAVMDFVALARIAQTL